MRIKSTWHTRSFVCFINYAHVLCYHAVSKNDAVQLREDTRTRTSEPGSSTNPQDGALVVLHICRSRVELQIALDDLVHST